jgi:geranylgeranyl reductase family protein
METCDVLIAGGGPAGSTCAWALRQAGLDVVIMDRTTFPRDKVCAGWITPGALTDLRLDVHEYQHGRTFQPFTGFRVGVIGSGGKVDVEYDQPVSFGIRRCEFDEFLLRRAGARLRLGTPLSRIRRDGHRWTVNESIAAPMLVGAGGHFCPVAGMLNGSSDSAALVVAQEAEFPIDPRELASFATVPERPELYFSRALDGYGWCLRKENYLNIGFGHMDRRRLPSATAGFAAFLKTQGRIPGHVSCRWKGHAYVLAGPPRRRVDDGVLLVGDAAGLASPQSGEGIRPAIESGLIAASTIIEAHSRYTSAELAPYEERLRERFGISRGRSRFGPQSSTSTLGRILGPWLLRTPWFVRHVLLDRWFLHVRDAALACA